MSNLHIIMVTLLFVIRFNIGTTTEAKFGLIQGLARIMLTTILAVSHTLMSLELHSIRIVPPSRA